MPCRRKKIHRHAKTCETQCYVDLVAFQLHRERFCFVFAENGLSIRSAPCLRLYTGVAEILAVQVLLLLSYSTASCLRCIVSHVGNELSLGKDSCQAVCM